MSRFNTRERTGVRSPIASITAPDAPPVVTAKGGSGVTRDPRSELFLLAVSSMVSTKGNFHEGAIARDTRMISLIEQVASDHVWINGFVRFLRERANLRTVSLMVAAHAVKARLDADLRVHNKGIISAALQRPDEPAEMVAYWRNTFGRELPMPVKRGVSEAIAWLYTEFNALKYDAPGKAYSFRDVLRVVHPEPSGPVQDELFKWLTKGVVGESLTRVAARAALMEVPVEQRREVTTGQLKEAGMTWEAYSSYIQGPMDARSWQTVIPLMGYMALLRNLRNFDKAGIDRITARQVEDRLVSPEQVAKSRQLPMRFLSAYRATHGGSTVSAWPKALEQAMNLSLVNVPRLNGRTLVLVDLSGSMFWSKLSDNSDLTFADAAAIFGAALALRAESADLYGFGSGYQRFDFTRRSSLLPLANRISATSMGGTDTMGTLRSTFIPGQHTRIVIVTDEQYDGSGFRDKAMNTLLDQFGVPTYTWNLAGYKVGQAHSGKQGRHTFGGLSDNAFRMINLLEQGVSQNWDSLFVPTRSTES